VTNQGRALLQYYYIRAGSIMELAYSAMRFAMEVHATQVRKYTGEPYAAHLAEVAGIVVSAYVGGFHNGYLTPPLTVVLATAWLHDCIEDQNVTFAELRARFGYSVAEGVHWLTDCEVGNRAARKAAACIRLAQVPGWVQSIKCADLISNTRSIVKHDPKFAEVYLPEKAAILCAMTKADARLLELATKNV
jgi:guanosine-3',5'-bis(diphosphate) 3'-pyrophosphohydrolase